MLSYAKLSVEYPCLGTSLDFDIDFVDQNEQLVGFEQYVVKCANEWTAGRLHLPYGFLCQSRGYGKTRIAREFGKKHITVYACMNSTSSEYPPPSFNGDFPFRSMIANSIMSGLRLYHFGAEDLLVAIVDRALDQVSVIKRKLQLAGMHYKIGIQFSLFNS
jgi:hypothetical protein